MTILLVEDEPLHIQWATNALQAPDAPPMDILTCRTLAEAITLVQQHEIALVVLDLRLNDSVDYKTFEDFHRAHPRTPVLIWSVVLDLRTGVYLVRQGATWALPKPNEALYEFESVMQAQFVGAVMLSMANWAATQDTLQSLSAVPASLSRVEADVKGLIVAARSLQERQAICMEDHVNIEQIGENVARVETAVQGLQALLSTQALEQAKARWSLQEKLLVGLLGLVGLLLTAWAGHLWEVLQRLF
jgi:DNA-binding NarL/FixJ family response regulator